MSIQKYTNVCIWLSSLGKSPYIALRRTVAGAVFEIAIPHTCGDLKPGNETIGRPKCPANGR